MPCLGEAEYGGKGQRNFYAVTWPSISRNAGQATAKGNHQCQSKARFHAVGQEKKMQCIGREQESIFESEAWSRRGVGVDLHFVLSTKHKFCVSPGFISARATGRHVTRWEQVFFIFFLVQQS